MKKTYVIFMSRDGKKGSGNVVTVEAETEFEAIKEAERRNPSLKVAEVKVK